MNFNKAKPSVRDGFRTSHRKLSALTAKIDGRAHAAATGTMGRSGADRGLARAKAAPSTVRRGKTTRR